MLWRCGVPHAPRRSQYLGLGTRATLSCYLGIVLPITARSVYSDFNASICHKGLQPQDSLAPSRLIHDNRTYIICHQYRHRKRTFSDT